MYQVPIRKPDTTNINHIRKPDTAFTIKVYHINAAATVCTRYHIYKPDTTNINRIY